MENKKNEDKLQAEIIVWFTNNYCLKNHNPRAVIFSVPNGGNRNKIEAMTLKATGLLAGVSDLIILLPEKILFVELKTDKGIQSAAQKDFETRITNLGYNYYLVRSLEEFKTILI